MEIQAPTISWTNNIFIEHLLCAEPLWETENECQCGPDRTLTGAVSHPHKTAESM